MHARTGARRSDHETYAAADVGNGVANHNLVVQPNEVGVIVKVVVVKGGH